MTAFPRFARLLFVLIGLALSGVAFVWLVDWRSSFLIDALTVSAIVAGAGVALLETSTIGRPTRNEVVSSPLSNRSDRPDEVTESAFWLCYDQLSYRLLFPLAALLCAVILRCAADYLITGHAVVHKIHEYDAHRVLYPLMMAALTAFALWWVMRQSRLWERWAFWKPDRVDSGRALVASALLVLALLTEVFTAATVVLVTQGAITAQGANLTDTDIYWRTELLYLWQFVHSIPAVDATDTLNWQPPYHLNGISGGSLLLSFKVLVLLPIVGLIVDFIRHPRSKTDDPGIGQLFDALANRSPGQ